MTYLKFYQKERELFPNEAKIIFDSQEEIVKVTNKLCRHFGLPKLRVEFVKNKFGASYSGFGYVRFPFNVNHKASALFICHEVAHHYEHKKYGKSKHTKKLLKIIERMIKYCRKNNFWKDEFAKVKIPKPEPTKQELNQKKLVKVQSHIKRLETQIKRLTTILKKYKRKEKRLNSHAVTTRE